MSMKTMKATMGLRILKPIYDLSFLGCNMDRLQQAWQCHETGEIEWRDVEIVREPSKITPPEK